MLLQATWQVKLTGAGITLLAFTDRMEREPVIDVEGVIQTSQPLRAQYAARYGRQNVATTITFSQVRSFDTWLDASIFLAQFVAALPVCAAPDTLEISLQGGGLVTLGNAILKSAGKPTIKDGHRFTAEYTVIGGQLIYTAPGIKLMSNTTGAPLENTTGAPLQATNQS